MSKSYCITFNICYHANVDKIKIDYGLVPARFENGIWKSEVSNETFDKLQKKRNGYIRFFKKKDQVFCQMVVEGLDDDMLIAEQKLLKISEKYIRSKIPFRFEYKKLLRERIKRILHP